MVRVWAPQGRRGRRLWSAGAAARRWRSWSAPSPLVFPVSACRDTAVSRLIPARSSIGTIVPHLGQGVFSDTVRKPPTSKDTPDGGHQVPGEPRPAGLPSVHDRTQRPFVRVGLLATTCHCRGGLARRGGAAGLADRRHGRGGRPAARAGK